MQFLTPSKKLFYSNYSQSRQKQSTNHIQEAVHNFKSFIESAITTKNSSKVVEQAEIQLKDMNNSPIKNRFQSKIQKISIVSHKLKQKEINQQFHQISKPKSIISCESTKSQGKIQWTCLQSKVAKYKYGKCITQTSQQQNYLDTRKLLKKKLMQNKNKSIMSNLQNPQKQPENVMNYDIKVFLKQKNINIGCNKSSQNQNDKFQSIVQQEKNYSIQKNTKLRTQHLKLSHIKKKIIKMQSYEKVQSKITYKQQTKNLNNVQNNQWIQVKSIEKCQKNQKINEKKQINPSYDQDIRLDKLDISIIPLLKTNQNYSPINRLIEYIEQGDIKQNEPIKQNKVQKYFRKS